MKRNYRVFAVALVLISQILFAAVSLALAPSIDNVRFQQSEDDQVVVTYDLNNAEGRAFEVGLWLSPDGGRNFTIQPHTVTGDVGEKVEGGQGKRISWEVFGDIRKLEGTDFVFRVVAKVAGVMAGDMVSVSDFGFSIDKYEVTNGQYAEFVRATGHRVPECSDWGKADWNTWQGRRLPSGYESHPVVGVSREDAKAYCEWAGKRLPTAKEWQQACQGRDGRTYPWGEGIGNDKANYSGGPGRTTKVGSYSAGGSPYGAHDMSGNVWEWTASAKGSNRVLRGGSWDATPFLLRCAHRSIDAPDSRRNYLGFRCAR